MTTQNLFSDVFETDPLGRQALFQSTLPANANPFQAGQFQNLFQPTFNSFLGALGAQVKQNQTPDLSFRQFLSESFDPTRQLLRLPSGQQQGPTVFRF